MKLMSWDDAVASSIVNEYKHLAGATLPILHALQENFGYVDKRAVPLIADALNMSKAEIFGAITFYHDFRHEPAGQTVVKLCRAEACQAVGGREAATFLLASLGIGWGDTTPDGAVTVEAVYCLGLCAAAPAALVNGQPHGRLDGMSLIEAVAEETQP